MEIWPGKAFPLGAYFDGVGTNFSLFSEVAERVELCLFDESGAESRIDLPEVSGYCWHGYVPTIKPGHRYGFRVHGPWDPARGLRCNPSKLLIDPYCKSVEGEVQWGPAVFGHRLDSPRERNEEDSAGSMPRSVVVSEFFDWGEDRPLRRPWNDTVVYEVHVKGFTQLAPGIPAELRGTYAGLAHPRTVEYLKNLGVTAVELMPVHHFIQDGALVERGLRNYWGYNSLAYLAPHRGYAVPGQRPEDVVGEFKQMVRELHRSGLEVILDVVYNHTCEGNHEGPMLSLRGIDNQAYYRLSPEDPSYYIDYTGCGNSLNMRHPRVLQLIMDSLRYWVTEMHVDGFRFDLASALARELHDVDRLSAFFDIIQQDPVISQVKLIAEPWDLGHGGYQVGNFPPLWNEWNGKYRDTVRDFWRGEPAVLGEFANRVTGSADLYEETGRRPFASINFITCHDGFPLRDLVSYNEKHNEANGEDNRDGESHNRSWNCGVEGPTDDAGVLALRARMQRNFLTTLMLSQGVPMLSHGDEIGRTQNGNNNAYCQDNELAWMPWEDVQEDLLEFTRRLIELRRLHPILRRRHWFRGRPVHTSKLRDILWFTHDAQQMSDEHWETGYARTLGIYINGSGLLTRDDRGQQLHDDDFLVLFNAGSDPLTFTIPSLLEHFAWRPVVDTFEGTVQTGPSEQPTLAGGEQIEVKPRSVIVLLNGQTR